ncbi:GntR family transcriptional regulator [Sandarakinorhabdus sp. DWP1-3-1]|uniref:GntR family transcriptional regulator n=1 Tax=Sandarakinorhabdus sp. DWP1-3-1 TaxID=2804627 RepID=UPI003CF02738
MSRASERAYAEIRGLILSGDAPPGSPLTEEALADICGVSRTPVREALRRLESELYVVRSESQRLFVASWNAEDLAEMFALRAMLEAHAAARAATRISDDALEALRESNARLAAAIAAEVPDVATFLAENRAFHEIVITAAESPRLATMLAALVEQPVVRRTAARYNRAELARSAHEHGELVQAFAARDAVWAQAVMTGHIRRAFHAFSAAEPVK